jgi:hypothetical protein
VRELSRVLAGLLALLLLGHPYLVGGGQPAPRLFPVVIGILVVSGLVLWNDGAVTAAAGALAVHYLGTLYLRDVEYDVAAPLVAVGIVLFVELADLAISVPPGTPIEPGFVRARANVYAGRIALAVGTSVLLLAGAAVPLPAGPVRVLALAGAVAAVAVPVALLARPARRPS